MNYNFYKNQEILKRRYTVASGGSQGKIAEIAGKYLKKGEEVAIEGKLVHRSYENGKGEKKWISEISITELLLMGSRKSEKK